MTEMFKEAQVFQKKVYSRPELRVLGDVRSLTQSKQCGSGNYDGANTCTGSSTQKFS